MSELGGRAGRGEGRGETAAARAGTGALFVAVVLVILSVWRATLGFSLFDDSYYATVTIRLARGAALFADERLLQGTGVLLAVPFAKLWLALFGETGIVLALRLLYVAIAGVAGYAIHRALKPSFGVWPSLLPAAALLVAPPYNLFGITYNTVAVIGLALGTSLALAAVRDGSRRAAVASGACLALAAVAYPPLAFAGLLVVGMIAVLGRGRGLSAGALAGALGVLAVFAAVLLAGASVGQVAETWRRHSEMVAAMGSVTPLDKLGRVASNMVRWLTMTSIGPIVAWFLPAAALCVASVARRPSPRRRALAVALMPMAVALPVAVRWGASGELRDVATLGGNYLVALTLFLLPPVIVWVSGVGKRDSRLMLALAAPAGLAGLALVVDLSGASLTWASAIVGLAPLALAVLACAALLVTEDLSPHASYGFALSTLGLLVWMLFSLVFGDAPALDLHQRIASGPIAGILTSAERADEVDSLEAAGVRWVEPGKDVLFLGNPGGYLFVGGRPLTDTVWIGITPKGLGPLDRYTMDYFSARGSYPNVIFFTDELIERCGGFSTACRVSPLAAYVSGNYRLVESRGGLHVFLRREVGVPLRPELRKTSTGTESEDGRSQGTQE